MTGVLWALVVLPVAAGLALLAGGRRVGRLVGPAAVATGTVALVLAIVTAWTRPAVSAPLLAGLPAKLAVDGLSAVLAVTVTAVTLAVVVYAAGELRRDRSAWRFFGLILIFAGAMLVTVTATTLAPLLAGWEVMGATSYALIGYWYADPERVRGGEVAFLTTRTADLGLYWAAGAAVATGVPQLRLDALPDATGGWRDLIAAGFVIAALGKSAQLPVSFWLSRAMAGPSPVSALLHSATMVAAGGYLLLRVHPLLAATGWAGPLVAWIGAATALVLGAVALAQRDLKQLLAASTCAQLGYLVLAAGTGAVAGGAQQLVAHAATKSLLFLCAGAWLAALGTKQLPGLVGAARRHPFIGAMFTLGALSLAGVPPLSIWAAKDTVLSGAPTGIHVVGLAAAVVGAAYPGRALAVVWRTPRPVGEWREQTPRPVTTGMRIALPPLAAGAVGLGVLALSSLGARWAAVFGTRYQAVSPAELAGSALLGVATVAGVLALRRFPAAPPVLRDWLYLERAAGLLVARPVAAVARGLAAVDDRVIDGGTRGAAWLTARLSTVAGAVVELRVDTVVRAVAGAARRLGGWARAPQTGQLHQYYAQAVLALGILVVIAWMVSR